MKTNTSKNILVTEKSTDYELLDSGAGFKLERFGKIVLSRPDPQAIWSKSLTDVEWKKADAVFERTGTAGKWGVVADSSQQLASRNAKWTITLEGLSFELQLLPSKHLGIFPEQSVQWKWLTNKISNFQFPISNKTQTRKIKVLNLFGYTGGASLACAKAGAEVCHVDASEFAVDVAHKNMELCGLSDKKIRFIVDDARKFVEREIKRGNKYDIVLLDPPVYGKVAKGEVWKIEEDLLPLLSRIKNILSPNPLAIVLNGYASVFSHITYAQMLSTITSDLKGSISSGELVIQQSASDRVLPCGIFSRFEN